MTASIAGNRWKPYSAMASSECRSAVASSLGDKSAYCVSLLLVLLRQGTLHLAETWAQLRRWAAIDGTPIAPYTTKGGSLLGPTTVYIGPL